MLTDAQPKDATSWICLMYHDITRDPQFAAASSHYFSVSAEGFARQLDWIQQMGLDGRSIARAIEQPERSVAISFDDGVIGQRAHAFPALVRHRMTATFFVTTGWVGKPGHVSWEGLREMRDAGMSIQSHTHTHPFLSELDERELRDELRRSRNVLNERLEQDTTMLALPGGDAPKPSLHSVLADEGYAMVATSRWGINPVRVERSSPHYINRCTIRGEPSARDFARIVKGSRWLSIRAQSRERTLAFVRASVGPSRYARWRRAFLDSVTAPWIP